MNNDNKNKPFFCYSKQLKNELIEHGIKYESRGIHDKTHKPFWMFMPSDELNNYLEQRRSQFK